MSLTIIIGLIFILTWRVLYGKNLSKPDSKIPNSRSRMEANVGYENQHFSEQTSTDNRASLVESDAKHQELAEEAAEEFYNQLSYPHIIGMFDILNKIRDLKSEPFGAFRYQKEINKTIEDLLFYFCHKMPDATQEIDVIHSNISRFKELVTKDEVGTTFEEVYDLVTVIPPKLADDMIPVILMTMLAGHLKIDINALQYGDQALQKYASTIMHLRY